MEGDEVGKGLAVLFGIEAVDLFEVRDGDFCGIFAGEFSLQSLFSLCKGKGEKQ